MSNHTASEDHDHDKAFVTTFAMVLAALFGIFGFCILAANLLVPKHPQTEAEIARIQERIKPVGTVITDPALLVKVSSAAKHEPITGEQAVATVCGACHSAGVLGAPKIGDKAEWAKRAGADGGLDGLTANAIKGKNQMPARGGNPDLSDDEIKAAVKVMLEKSGA